MADISSTLVSNSTQLDNVDLRGGARDFTITGVTMTSGEQPLSIDLAEYDRPWKPGLTMRRVLSEIWGSESDAWSGRRVRLYRDDAVTFGKTKPGGTRISHASHIDKKVTLTLPTSKGKFGEFTVAPLPESAPESAPAQSEPSAEAVAACIDPEALRVMWHPSGPERREQIETRVAELAKTEPLPPVEDPNSQWDEATA